MCQASPVAQRIRRKNEVKKSWKFTCSFSSSFGSPIRTMPKSVRPMIENIKKSMISNKPNDPKEGADSSSV